MCTPKNVAVKREEKLKFKSQAEANCRIGSDVINSRVIITSPSSDVTTRESDINKPIAKKRHAKRRSLMLSEGSIKSSLRLFSQIFVLFAWLLSLTTGIGRSLAIVKFPGSKGFVGNSLEPCKFRTASVRYNLREFLVTVPTINEGLCFCITTGGILVNNKELIGYEGILRPRKRDEEVFLSQYLERARKLARFNSTTRSPDFSTCYSKTLTQNILAGKCFYAYTCPSTGFDGFKAYYFNRYTVNLELCDNFKVIFDSVCLYIIASYRSWTFCNLATFLVEISADMYTLVYFSPELVLLMFKSHDEYQSYILAGLGHIEKAKFENRSIFVHNRSYWREWRPLVTPWSDGIREGTEPWKCQKRPFLSHVLVSLSLCSLLPLLLCSYFVHHYY